MRITSKSTKTLRILFSIFASALAVSCQSGHDKLLATIQDNEKKLFSDSVHMLNVDVANAQVEAYKTFAEKFPDDSLSPEFIFKGADLANGLGKGQEAIAMLGTLQQKYPEHPKAQTALFMQAFIYETSLHDKDKAIAKYTEFIKKYPAHQLAQAAEFSLMQLKQGMSAEDVVKMFEARNDSSSKAHQ